MKLSFLGKTWNAALRNSTYMLVSNVILVVLLFISVTRNFDNHERVVLLPPHLDKKVEIAWENASGEYLESWGLYVATLIGNITPKNVKLVADSLGAFVDASIYPKVRTDVLSLAEDPVFQKANAINYFAPDRVIFEVDAEKNKKVFVIGQLITSSFEPSAVQSGNRSENRWVTYEMTLEMRSSRPWITAFTSYKGNQPHTMKWLATQQSAQPKTQPENAQ